MSESLELKYEQRGCREAVRKEEALPTETRNTIAVFLLVKICLRVRFDEHTYVHLHGCECAAIYSVQNASGQSQQGV